MNQRTYFLLLPLIILYLSIPLVANAQVTELVKISGDGQTGRPGQTLQPFIVEARDQNGDPVSGVIVGFLQDGGSLSTIAYVTELNGRAQTTLTLPRRAGTTTVRAWVGDVSTTFTATAIRPPPPPPPKPPRLLIISGHNQTGVIGETLPNPFAVRVRDPDNIPLEGVPVTFTVTAGGGTLSTTATVTDTKGRAESTLTLGSEPGTNTVEVRARGVSQIRIFSAEATLPPSVPTRLLNISGDNQTGFTGEPLANPFVTEVRDQRGDPMEGATVTFTVLTGSGTLSAETAMTDTNGRAESTLTLGTEPGTNTVEVEVEGIAETVTFSVEASLPPPVPTRLSIVSGDNQEGLTGEALADPLVVQVHDQYGDPMEGATVTFTVLTGSGTLGAETAMTDANGRAESTLTLGTEPGTNTVEVEVEGIAETVTFNPIAELLEFDLSLQKGLNLIHVPLKVRAVDGMTGTIESVADLYDALDGADTVHWLATYDSAMAEWFGYFGPLNSGTPAASALTDQTGSLANGTPTASALTDQTGILANMKISISVRIGGDALGTDGMGALTLNPGLNLVGLPLNDARITRVSDLFTLEEIGGDIGIIVVTDNDEFNLVGRADDPGDIEITGGQGFILIVQHPATVPIIGNAWDNTDDE